LPDVFVFQPTPQGLSLGLASSPTFSLSDNMMLLLKKKKDKSNASALKLQRKQRKGFIELQRKRNQKITLHHEEHINDHLVQFQHSCSSSINESYINNTMPRGSFANKV
jgi:hypothetical protein